MYAVEGEAMTARSHFDDLPTVEEYSPWVGKMRPAVERAMDTVRFATRDYEVARFNFLKAGGQAGNNGYHEYVTAELAVHEALNRLRIELEKPPS